MVIDLSKVIYKELYIRMYDREGYCFPLFVPKDILNDGMTTFSFGNSEKLCAINVSRSSVGERWMTGGIFSCVYINYR